MKQRILLIVAMLLVAAPAFAAVNITATQGSGSDNNKVYVRYTTGGEAVRAFALDFNLGVATPGPNNVVWSGIQDFNRGESNKPGGGYGIFPGQFRNNINPSDPNWLNQYYSPIAPPNDVDSNGTGTTYRKVICELGTLYKDSNAPGTVGALFTLLVDSNGMSSCPLTVTTNTVRGKVVLEDGSSVDPVITATSPLVFAVCPANPPATLTYPAADANNGRYQITWSAAADAQGYKLDRSADGGGTWVNIYTGTATSKCDDVNNGSYKYRVCATAPGCSDTAYNTGAGNCAVVLCFPTSEPNMATWKAQGKPRCWCYARQCKGDATGTSEGTTKTGLYWVGVPDLNIFMAAWKVKEPTNGPGLKGEPNICADFSHTSEGTTKTGLYRVGVPDLNIFMAAWKIKEPTNGVGIGTCPAGASGSRFTLPADFKPCN